MTKLPGNLLQLSYNLAILIFGIQNYKSSLLLSGDDEPYGLQGRFNVVNLRGVSSETGYDGRYI